MKKIKSLFSIALILLIASLSLSSCSLFESSPTVTPKESATDAESKPTTPLKDKFPASQPLEEEEESSETESTQAEAENPDEDEDKDFVGKPELQEKGSENESDQVKAADFSLRDQDGKRHKLKDYEGKVIVLNFWQTWCPPCRMEMPDFQRVYEAYGENQGDVIILGVASPKNDLNKFYTQEQMTDVEIKGFLEENGYTYPTLMDYTAEFYLNHSISSFPTTFVIGKDGMIIGRAPGALDEKTLTKIIEDSLAQ